MNYQRIYDQLIERAKQRVPEGYVERHHVKPVCMGGSDEKENLVALYPEEHFVAHALLLKIYKETEHRYSLAKAVQQMCGGHEGRRVRRKLYGWLKREHALAMSETQKGEGNSQFGSRWICNLETKENRKIQKDVSIPDGWISGRNKWNFKLAVCKICLDLITDRKNAKLCKAHRGEKNSKYTDAEIRFAIQESRTKKISDIAKILGYSNPNNLGYTFNRIKKLIGEQVNAHSS